MTDGATAIGPNPAKRVNYHLGLVLGEDEFRQDQHHLRSRDDRHQRVLHGSGTVAGLNVAWTADGQLEVSPGLAIDALGRTVCVPETQCCVLDDWLAARADDVRDEAPQGELHLVLELCYRECDTDLVPLPSEECRSADESSVASRTAESFDLRLAMRPSEAAAGGGGDEPPSDGASVVDAIEHDIPADLLGWVVGGAGHPPDAGPCLSATVGDGCIELARITVSVTDADPVRVEGTPTIDQTGRRFLLSSAALQALVLDRLGAGQGTLGGLADVDVDAAAAGRLLGFDGDRWTAVDPADGVGGPAGGDLGGEHPEVQVVGIRSRPVAEHAPQEGDVLRFDGEAWTPAPPGEPAARVVAAGTVTLAGEVDGPVHGGLEVVDRDERRLDLSFGTYRRPDEGHSYVVDVGVRLSSQGTAPIPTVGVRLLGDVIRLETDFLGRDVDDAQRARLSLMVSILEVREGGS